MIKLSDFVADFIAKIGVKDVFGISGGASLHLIHSIAEHPQLSIVCPLHEQAGAMAADGYSRVTRNIGVAIATSGPGATNMITGICCSYYDSIPVIYITGQVATFRFKGNTGVRQYGFQETDIVSICKTITKYSVIIKDSKKIRYELEKAYYIAQSGRPGPVLIDIPKDVGLEEFINYEPIQQKDIIKSKGYRFHFKTTNTQIVDALKMIKQASQPLLYVGGGSIISNSHKELLKLAEIFSIPVTTTLMGKGAFNENHSLSLGMLGMHGTAYANFAVSECDLLIAVGTRFDDRVTGKLDDFACHAQVLHIDIDPAEIGKNRTPQLAIVGDVKEILNEILKAFENNINSTLDNIQTKAWLERIQKWRQTYPLMIPQLKDKLSPQQVINYVGNLYSNAIFTTDVGQHQMWSAQFIKSSPRKWASSAGLGTMGYGLPAAIGAQVAFPNTPVICISGDSSIQMCIQELGAIMQYNLPIRLVIINNHWQGMVRQWQQSFYGERYSHSSMDKGRPDFINLAKSYGIKAIAISTKEEMEQELLDSKDYSGPIVFDFVVVEDENCYPMVAPGKSNSQMMGIAKQNDLKIEQIVNG